ncbi:unnamed protein product [Umbelopsis vinacea]
MPSFTHEQVAEHNTKADLYMIVHNKHPGGEEVLLDEGAKDATEAFEDVGHSDEARELLEKYYVGDLDKFPLRIIVPLLVLGGWIYFRFFA